MKMAVLKVRDCELVGRTRRHTKAHFGQVPRRRRVPKLRRDFHKRAGHRTSKRTASQILPYFETILSRNNRDRMRSCLLAFRRVKSLLIGFLKTLRPPFVYPA